MSLSHYIITTTPNSFLFIKKINIRRKRFMTKMEQLTISICPSNFVSGIVSILTVIINKAIKLLIKFIDQDRNIDLKED